MKIWWEMDNKWCRKWERCRYRTYNLKQNFIPNAQKVKRKRRAKHLLKELPVFPPQIDTYREKVPT